MFVAFNLTTLPGEPIDMLYENGKKVTEVNGVNVIDDDQQLAIFNFLQGAVYCWCNCFGTKIFTAPGFVGDKNRDWNGTPLQALYDGYGDEDAAGNAVGRLLKRVLIDDPRRFDRKITDDFQPSAEYSWDGK